MRSREFALLLVAACGKYSGDDGANAPDRMLAPDVGLPNDAGAAADATSPPLFPARIMNFSTRVDAVPASVDFVIGGVGSKKLVLRALGPTLGGSVLANPILTLRDATSTMIDENDDWKTNQAAVAATGLAPAFDVESAMVVTLAPGAYRMSVRGVDAGDDGTSVVEGYDLDDPATATTRIVRFTGVAPVSPTRQLIGGIISKGGALPFVFSGQGPSVSGIPDPTLTLQSATTIASNDDWVSSPNASSIADAGVAPSDVHEPAVLQMLDPGAYTVVLGVKGATGAGGVTAIDIR